MRAWSFSLIRRPAATHVEVKIVGAGGGVEPEPAKTVYQGRQLTAYGSYKGSASLGISWGTGASLQVPLELSEQQNEVVWLAHGARLITDEESKLSMAPGTGK